MKLSVWRVLRGRHTVNQHTRHSPGDFEAVHSLVVSGENTLKGQSQHFVQRCTETVQIWKRTEMKERICHTWTKNCAAVSQSERTIQHNIYFFGMLLGENVFDWRLWSTQKIIGTLKDWQTLRSFKSSSNKKLSLAEVGLRSPVFSSWSFRSYSWDNLSLNWRTYQSIEGWWEMVRQGGHWDTQWKDSTRVNMHCSWQCQHHSSSGTVWLKVSSWVCK